MIRRIEKNRLMKMIRLGLMWLVVLILLVLKYERFSFSLMESIYFCGMLFPVILGTSYYFNYKLVPKYLLTGKYRTFFLYAVYLLIVSVYLETWIVILSLVLLADYQFTSLSPEVSDVTNMALFLYVIVFVHGFSVLFNHFINQKSANEALLQQQIDNKVKVITVISKRKKVRLEEGDITHVESLSDYVKIHLEDRVVISKATISNLVSDLSPDFVRIHRSFFVNKKHVDFFTNEKVIIAKHELNISRTYKDSALADLQS